MFSKVNNNRKKELHFKGTPYIPPSSPEGSVK